MNRDIFQHIVFIIRDRIVNCKIKTWEKLKRSNFILDIKTDRNWEGVLRPITKGMSAPGRVREGDGVLVRLG